MMRILVTGASGQLGRKVVSRFRASGYDVVGTRYRRPLPGLAQLDLTDARACGSFLKRQRFDVVVHLAAIVDPDLCEKQRDLAHLVNVSSTENLLNAAKNDPIFIFVSSDYVFDGCRPPYREVDPREPKNYYGRTKSQSEDLIASRTDNFIVVRLPVLYGVGDPSTPTFLSETVRQVLDGKRILVDDYHIRYPTHTEDVASALVFLLRERFLGIVHLSATEKATKYGFACKIATWLGHGAAHLMPQRQPSPESAPRPRDSHLSTERFRQLGGSALANYSSVVPRLLAKL